MNSKIRIPRIKIPKRPPRFKKFVSPKIKVPKMKKSKSLLKVKLPSISYKLF